jgi:hypothetical protein
MTKLHLAAVEQDTEAAQNLADQLKEAGFKVTQSREPPQPEDEFDTLILVWSAAAAHIPSFQTIGEQHTKTIHITTLDDTPLPTQWNEIPVHQPANLVNEIKVAFQTDQKEDDEASHLEAKTPDDPSSSDETRLNWWQKLAIVASVLSIIASALTIMFRLGVFDQKSPEELASEPIKQTIAGTVFNGVEPLADVHILLPEYDLETKTKSNGAYRIEVDVPPHTLVRLHAQHPDFVLHRSDVNSGNTNHNFKMRPKQ